MLSLLGGFSAWLKYLLFGLLSMVLPIVLFNVWVEISEYLFSLIQQYFPNSVVLSFSGLTAWLITVLKIPQTVGVLLSYLSTRFVVQFLIRR